MVGLRIPLLLLSLWLTACGMAHVNADDEARPDTLIGVGATVMYPGQPTPAIGAPGGATSTGTSQGATGKPDPGASQPMTVIGGASAEKSGSERIRNTPLGPITTLFGYPFWIFGKSLEEKVKKEQGTTTGSGGGAPARGAPAKTPDQLEQERLEQENARLREELYRTGSSGQPTRSGGTISDELEALRSLVAMRSGGSTAATPPVSSPPTEATAPDATMAREAQDRDGDGRVDRWVYSLPDGRTREVLDDDGDGNAQEIRLFAPDGSLLRLEEDLDGDGDREVVSLYADGHLTHKRTDSNHDGLADTWSFYREGALVRHEVDRDGDGFRDLALFYEHEALVREEQDADGDGRADVVLQYAEGQMSRKEEDLDHDGTPDVISFYEGGKLVRKEIRSEEPAQDRPTEGS